MANQFGNKVRYLRRQQGRMQTDLSQAMSASGSHISNIEAGRKAPSLDTVIRIADVLQVTTDYLIRDAIPVETPVIYVTPQEPNRASVLTLFGIKLRYLRTQRNIQQTELAHQLGLRTQAHISLLEAGHKEPSISLVLRIADLFGVTTDYLLRDSISIESEWKNGQDGA